MKYSSCADRSRHSLCEQPGRFIRLVDGQAGAQSLSSDHHKVRAGRSIYRTHVRSCRPASEPLRYAFVDGLSLPDSRTKPPSYNVAPNQELYVIRHNHKTGERTLDLLRWGLIPHGAGIVGFRYRGYPR